MLSGHVHVRSARHRCERLLPLARATAIPARSRRCCAVPGHTADLRCERRVVRRAKGALVTAERRLRGRLGPCAATHATDGAGGSDAAPAAVDDHLERWPGRNSRSGGAGLRTGRAGSPLGRGRDLPDDHRRAVVSGRGHGLGITPDPRLGAVALPDGRADVRCPAHGAGAATAAPSPGDPSFGPRHPVHVRGVSSPVPAAQHRPVHGQRRRLLRQCPDGIVVRDAQARMHPQAGRRRPRGHASRRGALDRDLVQPRAAALGTRRHEPAGVRGAAASQGLNTMPAPSRWRLRRAQPRSTGNQRHAPTMTWRNPEVDSPRIDAMRHGVHGSSHLAGSCAPATINITQSRAKNCKVKKCGRN